MATGLDAKQAAMLAALQNLSTGLGDRYAAAEDAQAAMIGPDAPRAVESDGVADTILGRIGTQARSFAPAAKALLSDPAGALGRAGAAYDKSLDNHRAFGHEVRAEHPEASALADLGTSLAAAPLTGPRSLMQAAAVGAVRAGARSENPNPAEVLGEAVDGGAAEALGFMGGQALSRLVPNPAAEAAAARRALVAKADEMALKGSGLKAFLGPEEVAPLTERETEMLARDHLFGSFDPPSTQPYPPGQNPFEFDYTLPGRKAPAATVADKVLARPRAPKLDDVQPLVSPRPWKDPVPAPPSLGTKARWLLDDAGTAAAKAAPAAKAAALDAARGAAAPVSATLSERIAALLKPDEDEEGR